VHALSSTYLRRYYPLTRFTALDYFALSTFYEPGSLNERARQQGLEPARIPCAPTPMHQPILPVLMRPTLQRAMALKNVSVLADQGMHTSRVIWVEFCHLTDIGRLSFSMQLKRISDSSPGGSHPSSICSAHASHRSPS